MKDQSITPKVTADNFALTTRRGAEDYAAALLMNTGLWDDGWRFKWDRAKKRFGLCNHHKKTIQLSAFTFPHLPAHEVKDILLHELAHAIAGPGYGHGRVWKMIARKIGADPSRLKSGPTSLKKARDKHARWIVQCCDWEHKYLRKPTKFFNSIYTCRKCNKKVKPKKLF